MRRVDAAGKPLRGASLGLSTESGTRVSVGTTDANGEVLFSDLPEGNYWVYSLELSRQRERQTETRVFAGECTTLNLPPALPVP